MAAMKISVIFRLLLIAVCHRDTTEQSGAAEEEGPCPTDDPTINFLSLLPCTNTTDSANSTAIVETCDVFIYPAMLLAIEHINSNQDVLKYPEYNFNDTLRMIESETKGDVTYSSFFLVENIQPTQPIHGIIGADSSEVTRRIGYISGKYFQTHMFSFGAMDPALKDKERYPLLFKTIPSQEFLNLGRMELLLMFRWHKVGLLSSTEQVYAKTAENFVQLADHKHQDTMKATYYGSFGENPTFVFDGIYNDDVRIVLGMFSEKYARSVLCQAYNYDYGSLTDDNHVWMLPSYYNPEWWKLYDYEIQRLPRNQRCSNDEMIAILDSVLFVGSFNYRFMQQENEETTSRLTQEDFQNQLLDKTKEVFTSLQNHTNLSAYLLHSHAANAYDATWSLALAWDDAIPRLVFRTPICSLQFGIDDEEISNYTYRALNWSLNHRVHLEGISGNLLFNISQDAHGKVLVSQFKSGVHKPVGIFRVNRETEFTGRVKDLSLDSFIFLGRSNLSDGLWRFITPAEDFCWKGNNCDPPSDGFTVVHSKVPYSSLSIVAVFVAISISLAVALLVVNIVLRDNKHIKASSPRLNVLIIIGCIVVMPCSVFVGLSFSQQGYDISIPAADAICVLDLTMRNAGYLTILASLLVKNWRIYRIFYNSKMKSGELHLSDNFLLLLVFLFILPIVGLVVIWLAVDILHSDQAEIRIHSSQTLQVTFCWSEYLNIWRGACIGYTALLMLALAFLSLQNAKLPSRFMEEGNSATRSLLIMITVLFLFIITLGFLDSHVELYILVFWLNICWFVFLPDMLLFVIFTPKIILIYKDFKAKRRESIEEVHISELTSHYNDLRRESQLLREELAQKGERIMLLRERSSTSSEAGLFSPLSSPTTIAQTLETIPESEDCVIEQTSEPTPFAATFTSGKNCSTSSQTPLL